VQGTTLQDMTLVDDSVMSVVGFLAFSESPKKFRQDGAGKIGTQAYMLYECICPEPHTRPKLYQNNYLRMLLTAVAWSSPGGVAIRCLGLLPV